MTRGIPDFGDARRRDACEARDSAIEHYIAEMERLRTRSTLAVALALLSHRRGEAEQSWATVMSEMQTVRDTFIRSFEHFRSQASGRPDGAPPEPSR